MPPIAAIITSTIMIFLELAESAELIEDIADDADADTDDAPANADADADDVSTILFLLLYGYIIYNTCMFNMNNKRTTE